MCANISFHAIADEQIRPYQVNQAGKWVTKTLYTTTLDRSVTYRFFPHFHPYVPALIQRLNDGGFAELQDTDTLYLPQPNPSGLTVIPGSTQAILSANVTGKRPDGTSVALNAGTPLTLPDAAQATIPAGTILVRPDGSTFPLASDATVALPGQLPVSVSSGIQWTIGGSLAIIPDNSTVKFASGVSGAVMTADGTRVNLPANTTTTIRGGMPQPVYFQNFFSSYGPDAQWVEQPYPVKDINFDYDAAYSIYNWELFFHAPLLIAIHLSQNQQFQDPRLLVRAEAYSVRLD